MATIGEGGILGFTGLQGINFLGLGQNMIKILGIGVILIICIGIGFYVSSRRRKKAGRLIKYIQWYEESNGRLVPVGRDEAEELIIPGSNLRVFYVKAKDLYLPRFTKGITLDIFYLAITKNREIVNFTLKSLEKSMKESDLDYDHTDMRWATENTREFIKKNYRDKSQKWWKEYKDVIVTVIYIAVMTFAIIMIIFFMNGLVEKIGTLMERADQIIQTSKVNPGSGISSG